MNDKEWVRCKTCHLSFPNLNKNGDCNLCKHAKANDHKNTLQKWIRSEEKNTPFRTQKTP